MQRVLPHVSLWATILRVLMKTCHQLSWNLHRDAYHPLAPLGNWEKHWPILTEQSFYNENLRTPNEELEFLTKKHNAWWQTKIPFYLMTRKLHFVIPFVLQLKISLVFYMPFKSLNKLCKNVGPKSFCFTKPTCFWHFFIQFQFAKSHTEHCWRWF